MGVRKSRLEQSGRLFGKERKQELSCILWGAAAVTGGTPWTKAPHRHDEF